MELLSFLSFSFLVLLILHSLALFRKRNLPPGPLGLPIFGNLFDIGQNPQESLAKLAETYGPLMTISQGSVTTIVASSAEMAKQVLQKHDIAFSGRMIPDAITQLDHPSHAIAWLPTGDQWRLIRKVLHALLTNTQKLDTLRELRYSVMQEMVEHVKQVCERDEGIGISKLAFTTAINQLSRTCFSENVAEYDSKDANEFKSAVTTIMEITGKFNLVDYFPLLKGFDPQRMRSKAKAAYGCLEVLCDKYIYQRLRHRESNLPRHGDFLDSLLDFNEENESDFKLKHIQALLVDMFLAGTETTTYTTEWVITQLILHPDVMIKLRNEIRQTFIMKGRIDEAQILELPYLQAVIKETMRLRFAVPFLLPHKTEMDVNLNGYFIPKNTQVLVNAWAIARDPELWENPSAFMPQRFLYKEMDFSGQHFEFLPFGSGRRICPGMPVAHRVVSLMIASLVHHFDWELPNGMKPELLDLRQTFGLTLQRAKPLLAVPRILKEESI